MMSRWSVRARITVGSLLVAAVLLAAALFIVRQQVATTLTDADTALARSDLVGFEKDIIAHPTEGVDNPGTGVLVYIRNPAGLVQVNTVPRDVEILVEQKIPADEQYSIRDDEGRSFVIVGQIVETSAGDWALWSARSTNSSELALEGLDRVLIVAGVALMVGFGLASWLLATAALRPVARMRKRAEELGAEPGDGDLPVGPAQDELAQLARTLNSLLHRVRRSSEHEKRMVSDAAHELRTPLAALKTQLELAHNDFADADALAARVVLAENSVNRLASLANNLLELSRVEAAKNQWVTSTTSQLVTELMGSIDRARMLALAKSVDVGFDLIGIDTELGFALDAQSFGRLTDNVLSNAVSAVEHGGTVALTMTQDEEGIAVEVADDGPGVPESFIPRAFERFTRPDPARSEGVGGSGLGLALVRAIATSAGGEAALYNTYPGLTVVVVIPKM